MPRAIALILLVLAAGFGLWRVTRSPATVPESAIVYPAADPGAPVAGDPIVSLWYRGGPGGAPTLDDLATIRALDFNGVTWPAARSQAVTELLRLAGTVGLAVVTRDRPVFLTPESALSPGTQVDVAATGSQSPALAALVWRAVAHGARVVSFDAGAAQGAGVESAAGVVPAWLAPAKAIARDISFNAALMAALRPGGPVVIDAPKPPALDVVLLDAGRSWVVVATSGSPEPVKATVHLPAGVPYALWVSLLDGSNMAMVDQPDGPRWTVAFGSFGAAVYIIDKKLK